MHPKDRGTSIYKDRAPILFIGENGATPSYRRGRVEHVDTAARQVKQQVRRQAALSSTLSTALASRVTSPGGDLVYHATWDEFMHMRKDPQFRPLSAYAQNLFFYTDGRTRPKPIRALLENEVGMITTPKLGTRVVCLKTMPGEKHGGASVIVSRKDPAPLVPEPDPFPSPGALPKITVVR